MNGTEQRARHNAVSRVERRMDDLELLTVDMASDVVAGREATKQAFAEVDRQFQAMTTLDRHVGLAEAFLTFEHQTLWQRLRWLVRGVAR